MGELLFFKDHEIDERVAYARSMGWSIRRAKGLPHWYNVFDELGEAVFLYDEIQKINMDDIPEKSLLEVLPNLPAPEEKEWHLFMKVPLNAQGEAALILIENGVTLEKIQVLGNLLRAFLQQFDQDGGNHDRTDS